MRAEALDAVTYAIAVRGLIGQPADTRAAELASPAAPKPPAAVARSAWLARPPLRRSLVPAQSRHCAKVERWRRNISLAVIPRAGSLGFIESWPGPWIGTLRWPPSAPNHDPLCRLNGAMVHSRSPFIEASQSVRQTVRSPRQAPGDPSRSLRWKHRRRLPHWPVASLRPQQRCRRDGP